MAMTEAVLPEPSRDDAGPGNAPPPIEPALDPGHEAHLAAGIRLARNVIRGYRTLTPEDAEDLAQEIGIIYLNRHETIENPPAWFFECARRAALNQLRKRRPAVSLTAHAEEPAAPAPHENSLSVKRMFFALSGRCRTVLGCILVEGRTLEEIAAACGRSVNQVFTMKQRCLKLLRARWLHARPPEGGVAP
jgi:RNA polymerase sigma factor (sigma-70 family)